MRDFDPVFVGSGSIAAETIWTGAAAHVRFAPKATIYNGASPTQAISLNGQA
jgi:hypothetical protein